MLLVINVTEKNYKLSTNKQHILLYCTMVNSMNVINDVLSAEKRYKKMFDKLRKRRENY